MKKLLVILAFALAACTSTPPKDPTPFQTGAVVQPLSGCIELRKEVDAYNAKNPTTKKVADC